MREESMNFIQSPPPSSFPSEPPERRRRPILKLVIFLVLLLGVGGCITRVIFGEQAPEDPAAYDPLTLEPKKPEGLLGKIKHLVFQKQVALEGDHDDRTNILVLGQGGPGHDGPFLTDTIIIASIKPSTGQIGFISIPRDLAVNIPGQGVRKINHANAFGEAQKNNLGPALAASVIHDTFNIDIHYYIRVDFKAFEEIIDDVGGLTVNVDTAFVDTEYPAPNFEYQVVSFAKGPQTMDGDMTLKFVRSRHGNNGEGSDFARSKRQQKVLLALKEKVISFQTLTNPVRINNIFNSLEKHITTDMQFSDMIALLKTAKNLNTENILTLTLDDSEEGFLKPTQGSDGAFLLVPKTDNFTEINNRIEHIFDQPTDVIKDDTPKQAGPELNYSSTKFDIQNGTWNAGLAARVGKRLGDKNFKIATIGNTTERPIAISGIFVFNAQASSDVVDALKAELNIPIKQLPPKDQIGTSTADVLVVLGEDFTE